MARTEGFNEMIGEMSAKAQREWAKIDRDFKLTPEMSAITSSIALNRADKAILTSDSYLCHTMDNQN